MKQGYLRLNMACLFFIFMSTQAVSDVFKWTDEHGQIHFSDRAPHEVQADNISNKLKQVNITGDLSSPEMMLRHEQAKDANREARYSEQQERLHNQPSQSERCAEAKKHLKLLKGRVVFVDENGKDLKISEETRKLRASQLENDIRQHCQ